MGNKLAKQNRYQKKLKSKIQRFENRSLSTNGLKKELAYSTGEAKRGSFTTGHAAGDIKAQEKFRAIKLKRKQALQE